MSIWITNTSPGVSEAVFERFEDRPYYKDAITYDKSDQAKSHVVVVNIASPGPRLMFNIAHK